MNVTLWLLRRWSAGPPRRIGMCWVSTA